VCWSHGYVSVIGLVLLVIASFMSLEFEIFNSYAFSHVDSELNQHRCLCDLVSWGHMTRFPGSIQISKRTHWNAATNVRCVYNFLFCYSRAVTKNSSWVQKSAIVFVYILLRFYWLDIWYLGSEDLSPCKGRNSKFNGFRTGSLFLAQILLTSSLH